MGGQSSYMTRKFKHRGKTGMDPDSYAYLQSVPQETSTRPSVDTAKPCTAPWWPGNR